MPFTPIMFARHALGEDAGAKRQQPLEHACVVDLGGSEAMPFLAQEFGLDVVRLTAKGMGLRHGSETGVMCVYYFAENAFRLVLEKSLRDSVLARLNQGAEGHDISVVERSDLAITKVCGEDAFDSLVEQLNLTPGLRLADEALCYCAQSGDVFITVQSDKGAGMYQLIVKHAELEKWQQQLQQAGFAVSEHRAA